MTDEQQRAFDALNHSEGVASHYVEHGAFFDGARRYASRVRVSTYSLHGFGVLILNPDGRVWDDGGEILLPV